MNKIKRIIALLMVPVFFMLCSCSGEEQDGDEVNIQQTKYTVPAGMAKKTETVYVNMDNTGKRTKTVVTDWIHTDSTQVYVDDSTNLEEIENVKDYTKPEINGQSLRWHMNKTDIYYQGTTDAKLPLNFIISYKLNGVPIKANELVGKSGKVEITVAMDNVDPHTVTVNGEQMTMYNPLLVVGGVSLSESKFQNISVKNGKIVGNGSTQYAVLVGFPGIEASLGVSDLTMSDNTESTFTFDDTFVISADANNFELGNIMFAAVPIASLDIGLNNITGSMDQVRDTLNKLKSIQTSLQSMNADALLKTLTSSPDKLSSLSSLASQAAGLYEKNKALINVLNKYTTPENLATIQALTDYIGSADIKELENSLNVINSIFGNDASSAKLTEGMKLLKEMQNDLNDPQVKAAIDGLPQTISTLNSLKNAIDENKELITVLQSLSNSSAFQSLATSISGIEGSLAASGLSSVSNVDANKITAKMTAWIQLGKKYTIFTKKPSTMNSSVMFIYKADSIKIYGSNDDYEIITDETEAEESSGLMNFFNKMFGKKEG